MKYLLEVKVKFSKLKLRISGPKWVKDIWPKMGDRAKMDNNLNEMDRLNVENQWKWVKVILDHPGVGDQSSKTRGYPNVIFSQLYRVYQLYNFMTF